MADTMREELVLTSSGIRVSLVHGVGRDMDIYFDKWPAGGGYLRIRPDDWDTLRDWISERIADRPTIEKRTVDFTPKRKRRAPLRRQRRSSEGK